MALSTLGWTILALYALGAILAAWVALAVGRAFRLTRAPFLLSFALGFVVLEVSYLFVVLNRILGANLAAYHETLWVHETTQVAAFALVAAAYVFDERPLGRRGAALFHGALAALVGAAIAAFLLLPPGLVFPGRMRLAQALYLLGLALALFTLLRTAWHRRSRPEPAVVGGFAAWLVAQAGWVAWGWTDAGLALLLANAAHVAGLALFALALRGPGRR